MFEEEQPLKSTSTTRRLNPQQDVRTEALDSSSLEQRGVKFPLISEKDNQNNDMEIPSADLAAINQSYPPANSSATPPLPSSANAAHLGATPLEQVSSSSTSAGLKIGDEIENEISLNLAPSAIQQVSTPEVRSQEAIQEVQNEAEIAQELVRTLKCLEHHSTMSFLKMLDLVDMNHPGNLAFWMDNYGRNLNNSKLLLNNSTAPVEFDLQGETVTPPIILAGSKSKVRGENGELQTYEVPTKTPGDEENETIRNHVYGAFKAYYGHINDPALRQKIGLIILPENCKKPIIMADIGEILAMIEANEKEKVTNEKFLNQADLRQINEIKQSSTSRIMNDKQTYEKLIEKQPQKDFTEALYDIARMSATRKVGTTSAMSTLLGSASGQLFGFSLGSIFGAPVVGGALGSAIGGVVGASTIGALTASAINGAAFIREGVPTPPVLKLGTPTHIAGSAVASIIGGSVGASVTTSFHNVAISGAVGGFLGGAVTGGITGAVIAIEYFKPGSFQKVREALWNLSQNEEKITEFRQALKTALASHEEVKTALTDFFADKIEKLETKLEETSAQLSSSSAVAAAAPTVEEPASSLEKIKADIKIIREVEKILISEIDTHLAQSRELIDRLDQVLSKRREQKEEHARWKGTTFNTYRRPGI